MTSWPIPPEVEEELAVVQKAIDGLRAGAARRPQLEPLDPEHPAARDLARQHAEAMRELEAVFLPPGTPYV